LLASILCILAPQVCSRENKINFITLRTMKIKDGFMLCPVMGKTMVIATGELEKTFSGMIKMNETSAFIWRSVDEGKEPEQIYPVYAETFGIDLDLAKTEVDSVIEKMTQAGVFE